MAGAAQKPAAQKPYDEQLPSGEISQAIAKSALDAGEALVKGLATDLTGAQSGSRYIPARARNAGTRWR